MSGRQLYAEINAVRALVSDGLSRLTGAVDDLEPFWIAAAHARLTQVDALLVRAAGGIAAPVRVAGTLAAWSALLTAAAAGLRATGPGTVWTIAGTALVALALAVGTPRVTARIGVALSRRRLARAGGGVAVPGGDPAAAGLVAAPELLLRARVRLVSIALRRAGTRRWTTTRMRRAAARDPAIDAIRRADLLLCQAIDCLESYLDHLEKE